MRIYYLRIIDKEFPSVNIEKYYGSFFQAKLALEKTLETHKQESWRFSLKSGDILVNKENFISALNGEYHMSKVNIKLSLATRKQALEYLEIN